tara:strand:+ start:1523 stop:3880 length:2358 start_codon:yes stop_codon:yes gene_type:complete
MATRDNPFSQFFAGAAMPSNVQAGLTTSAIAKATREEVALEKEKQKYNSDIEVLEGLGIIRKSEDDDTVSLTDKALENMLNFNQGNRAQGSKALLMDDMFGSYIEERDGKLIKKKNRAVYAPTLAKGGVVPTSVQNAFDNEEDPTKKAALQTEIDLYKAGKKKAYVTPAINQEGRFSLLNLFGTNKEDDVPMVYTESEIMAGLQSRVSKFNLDADRLFPRRSEAVSTANKIGAKDISNIGGGTDESFIELVNGVYDEKAGRGTTNAFLKNLEKIYNANPQFFVEQKPASTQDSSIEPGSEQDVMVDVQGVQKTFEQAYPTLVGLDGMELNTEINNLMESGAFDSLGEEQKNQIFKDLEEEGIGSVPDLIKKRQDQKKDIQQQYKEVYLLNILASRPDANGKLVLPDGRTAKDATDEIFNAYYTGAPGATLGELATAQDARQESLRAQQAEDTAQTTAETEQMKTLMEWRETSDANALEWHQQFWTEKTYWLERQDGIDQAVFDAYKTIGNTYTENVRKLKIGDYDGEGTGITFDQYIQSLRNLMKDGDFSASTGFFNYLFGFGDKTSEMPAGADTIRAFNINMDSINDQYYNSITQNGQGRILVENAEKAFLSIAGDDEEAKANLQKMWNAESRDIYIYNYAKPARNLEMKHMQEEKILQKVFASLENDESLWTAVFGGIPIVRTALGKGKIGDNQTLQDYWGDVWADDLSASALANPLRETLAIRYEDGAPVELVAIDASGNELEESVPFDKYIKNGSISGTELNWLIMNLKAIGDVDNIAGEE